MKNYIQARQPRQSTSVVLDFPGSPLLMDVIKHIVVLDHNNEESVKICFLGEDSVTFSKIILPSTSWRNQLTERQVLVIWNRTIMKASSRTFLRTKWVFIVHTLAAKSSLWGFELVVYHSKKIASLTWPKAYCRWDMFLYDFVVFFRSLSLALGSMLTENWLRFVCPKGNYLKAYCNIVTLQRLLNDNSAQSCLFGLSRNSKF